MKTATIAYVKFNKAEQYCLEDYENWARVWKFNLHGPLKVVKEMDSFYVCSPPKDSKLSRDIWVSKRDYLPLLPVGKSLEDYL